ncbi:hypothetical protein CMQ_6592 [Grosmannia clavigera kw1407]|uniref:Uncharacterized protein n=1 Tax=Grosmannia clavigera (strain kw1407 / UAMH 11150) TaxID=655863 RepID=F0X6R8_GROCL|nr:uncharacterized protein CMQ_6592 [Grosmannia clavigera kw1407]EFX06271.1 hypothetical protein CMQ_6592 [Grosmannia clavigera kw1407]
MGVANAGGGQTEQKQKQKQTVKPLPGTLPISLGHAKGDGYRDFATDESSQRKTESLPFLQGNYTEEEILLSSP